MKKTIFVDMDGVIANFAKAAEEGNWKHRPDMWGAKREWIAEHFPWLKRKLILTHRKDLLIGDILIDDSRWRGQPDFKGHWIWFGHNARCKDWESTLKLIYKNYI